MNDEYITFDDFMAKVKSRDDVDGVVAYSRMDDNSTYEKQWAEAIDRTLADATLEAFKNSMRDCIASVLKQDDVSDRHLKWLRAQMNKKIDILDKIIHLNREDVTHEEHGDDGRREAEEEH